MEAAVVALIQWCGVTDVEIPRTRRPSGHCSGGGAGPGPPFPSLVFAASAVNQVAGNVASESVFPRSAQISIVPPWAGSGNEKLEKRKGEKVQNEI